MSVLLSKVISQEGVSLESRKVQALTDMPPPKPRRNYIHDISKTDWEWNGMYQNMYNRANMIIKKDAYMKFYDTFGPLYLKPDASGGGLRARSLQVRDGMNCGHNEVSDNATLCPIALASKKCLLLSGTTGI